MTHGRAQIQDIEIGAKADGTIVGLRGHIIADVGAYPAIGVFLPTLTRMMAAGVYTIPKIDVRASVAVTNTTTVGAYRGAGRPEAAALIERAVDMVAAELGLDPVDGPAQEPHPAVRPAPHHRRRRHLRRRRLRRRPRRGRSAWPATTSCGRSRRPAGSGATGMALGIGVSVYVEVTGAGPVPEFGSVEVHADGSVTAQTGTSPHGQGHETAFAQIISATLGVPMEAVTLLHSDTAAVPEGQGTYGSRSLQLGGSSILVASETVLTMARERAANLLEANPDDVVLFDDGRFGVAGTPARSLGWEELADGGDGPLRAEAKHPQSAQTYPFGAHVAVVEVDTETGGVDLQRIVAVDDCGRILNPLLAEGQVHGGLAQGIAQALFEEFAYDADGTPLTATLADYLFPSAAELPSFETAHTETPTPLNPLGAKGIGESGTIGSTPAVQNAVVDAVAHLGVRHIDMPCTPGAGLAGHPGGSGASPARPLTAESVTIIEGFGEPDPAAAPERVPQDHRPLLRRPARRGLRPAGRPAPARHAACPTGAVEVVYPTVNADASARTYSVDSRDLIRSLRAAEAQGLELVGVFHSHTHTEAWPSPTDVRQAMEPGWLYVIVSLKDGDPVLRSFRITDGKIQETPVVLES